MENYAELMFTDAVAKLQKQDGSYERFQTLYPHRSKSELGEDEIGFITNAVSFYMASVNETGWPYIQHRGGPPGLARRARARPGQDPALRDTAGVERRQPDPDADLHDGRRRIRHA